MVRRTTNQSYTNGVAAPISWDTQDQDNDNIWTLSPNPTRLTIPGSGAKAVTISVFEGWEINISGIRRIAIYKNGSLQTGMVSDQAATLGGAIGTNFHSTFQLQVSGGDYLEVYATETAGTINLTSAQCTIKIDDL
jgi:hypothetical protein